MSTKRSVGGKLLAPLIAAGTSAAASYVVKKGPAFAENTLLPWLRQAVQDAGGAAEKLPEKARSAVSSGGDLAEQLTDQARNVTGLGDGGGSNHNGRSLSPEELAGRAEERAQRRAKRRKAER